MLIIGLLYLYIHRGLLAAAKSLGHEDTFYWIASDGWGKQQQVCHEVKIFIVRASNNALLFPQVIQNLEEVAVGAITVELGKSFNSENFPKSALLKFVSFYSDHLRKRKYFRQLRKTSQWQNSSTSLEITRFQRHEHCKKFR